MLHTHDTVKVHYLSPHNPFNPLPKPHCCTVTEIHQEVGLICVHSQCPLHLSVVLLNTTSLFLTVSPPLYLCGDLPTTRHSLPTQTPEDEPRREHLHSGGGKAEICSLVFLFFFFHLKIFYLRINVLYKLTFKCTASAGITQPKWKTSNVGSMLYSYISCQTNKRSENHK